jgi:hypothetical protein
MLKLFSLDQEVVFCLGAILKLGLSYVSNSIFGHVLNGVRGGILENVE